MLSISILATCRTCGNVKLECCDLSIIVSLTGDGLFVFRCPLCGHLNARACGRSDVSRLAEAGVRCIDLGRRQPPRVLSDAPALVMDDILRFTDALRDEDYLADVVARQRH
jgi:hypothetical protein